jgi:acyl-CoA thioesterase FadM
MGNLREYILTPVKKQLLRDLGSGEFGMVTNNSSIRIYNEADTLDKITGRLWITEKSDLKNSLINLGYEWLKHTDDGNMVKMADCELSTTWVRIESRGIVKLSPIPEYFYNYLDHHMQKDKTNERPTIHIMFPTKKDLGLLIYKSTAIPRPTILLNKQVYQTGIFNGNSVGNLYYSNYYDWQAKNIESYLFSIVPEIFLNNGRQGEYICLETNVNHLQEAMPFEEIEVDMYLDQLHARGCRLYFEYFSLSHGIKRKLAYGYNQLLWCKRQHENVYPEAMDVPEKLMERITQNIGLRKETLN